MRSTAARIALPAAVAIVVLVAVVASAPSPAAAQTEPDGATTFAIEVRPDGDASFVVTVRLRLESQEEAEAFDQLAADHVAGSSSPLSESPFEQAAAGASEVTGRQMAVRDVSREAARQNRTGRLVLSFTWTNFSMAEDDRLIVGDAFQTPTGTWLPRLEADQELVVSFPDGYTVQSVSRPLRNGTIHVEGPATFEPGQPSAVLAGSPAPWWEDLLPAATGAGILLALVLVLFYGARNRERLLGVWGGAEEGATAGNGGGDVVESGEGAPPADDPLLSDEERVLRLLEREGGRMKQVDIVEATDWSNAKVSQLLSDMADEGRIDKLRIGRENLISLPGQGPGSR